VVVVGGGGEVISGIAYSNPKITIQLPYTEKQTNSAYVYIVLNAMHLDFFVIS
jgi:hypothetical protein